jgi:lysine 6-dehydrogenase
MKNKYIVLGAGTQGVAAAFDLALNGSATRVTLADIALSKSRAAIQRIRGLAGGPPGPVSTRLTASVVDAQRESDLYKTILGHDGTLSALPSRLNLGAARASIAARTHYVDLGGPYETTQDILRLDRPAQKMGVALVPDAALAPGLCNAVAADAIARLEKIRQRAPLRRDSARTKHSPAGITNESRIWRGVLAQLLSGYPTF